MKTTRSFKNDPESVPAARRFALDALAGVGSETLEAVELVVSELATNCIRHTDSEFELTITRTSREVCVEATDRAGGEPRLCSPGPYDAGGRGLRIVDVLSDSWGIRMAERGKTVWMRLPLTA